MKPKRSRIKLSIRTILKWGLVVVIGVRVGNLAVMTLCARDLAANNDRIMESVELLTRLSDLSSGLKDAESAQRGFVITGHKGFLTRYHVASAQATMALLKLEELAPRARISPSRLELLKQNVSARIDEMQRIISVRQERGMVAAAAIVKEDHGKALSSAMAPLIAELERTERDQLTRRTAKSAAFLRQTPVSLLAMAVLALILVIGVYFYLVRLVGDQERYRQALIEQAERWQVSQEMLADDEHRQSLSREQENTRRLQELARLSTQLHLAHDFDTILKIVATESRKLLGVRRVEATTEPCKSAETAAPGIIDLPITGRDGQKLAHLRVTLMQVGDFDDRDRAILDQLVHMASVAIENARLYQELRENDHSKDQFLAMLAHELRNPLAAISNAVTLGRHNGQHDHHRWSLDVVERQAHRLTQLIDDLLDVSRITQGKIRLHWESVDLGQIAASAIEAVRPLLERRKHTFKSVIPATTFWVNGDSSRLEQIFTNLLTNAAKYTESGGQISLTIARDGNEIVVRVKDSGIGISPDLLPRIFDLFTQGDRSLARSEGGLGIGLTLVKSLTELHGGSVNVASDGLDAGSEFTVRLPAIRKPLLPARNGHTSDRAEIPDRAVRILVVDDNIDLAHGLSRLIDELGHVVQAVNDGPAAIESAHAFRPEAVLLDIGLPGMDGYEVASRLRSQAGAGSLILVAISGYGQEEDRRRSHEAGFDFHLVKPIDLDALRHIINRVSRSSISPVHSPS